MIINGLMTDKAVLKELGHRLARRRIAQELTQEDLANEAGVAKRTLERLEAGQPSQLLTVVRVLRALNVLGLLEVAIPEVTTHPMDLLKMRGKERQRVSSKKKKPRADIGWAWGDE
ncbi:MAG: helix-turn-helix domain-containing protein [Desulfuromusa sp.]